MREEHIREVVRASELGLFAVSMQDIQKRAHEIAKSKGWYERERGNPELIALIHSELSECLEALRKGNPSDEHLPEYQNAVIELADAVIRIMDMAEYNGWNLGEAIIEKMKFNQTREKKHGKEF